MSEKKERKKNSIFASSKYLSRYIGEYRKETTLTPLFTAGEVFMEILLPFITAKLIDQGIEASNMANVWKYGLLMAGCAFISLWCGIQSGRYASTASAGFAANLRKALYAKIQTFSFANIDKFSTAGLVTRLTTDVTNVQNAFQMIIRIAVRTPLMLIMSLVMSLSISPSLSTVFLWALAALLLALAFLVRGAMKSFKETFDEYDNLNERVEENVSASRVVKAYVREDYETDKFKARSHKLRSLFEKAEGLMIMNFPIMNAVIYGCIIALSWMGAHQVVGGTLTTGELTSLFSYVMQALMSMMMLSMVFVMITMSSASADRISEVLEEVPDIQNPASPVTDVKDGSVDFDHVSFSYKSGTGDYVLKDIDLHIHSGETIGIIGGTGSGKTTLVSLISRLYDATEGKVKVGGRDVKEYDLEALRKNVAVVLQKNVLFSGSVYDNLRWGKEDASDEECQRAAQAACADEFLQKSPDGYNTHVEQGGANFSGGQKQRLCIARALMEKPRILILDDSTSAVDTATEKKIRESLKNEIPDATKIIIAQRVSSVESADRILVLDNGEINAFDTPERLLETNEIYQEIYQTQKNAGADFDQPGKEAA